MAHHTHLVKCRLSVKHNIIVVLHVSLDLVAYLKVKVTGLGVKSEVNSLTIVTDDVFGPRVLVGTSPYQLM